MQYRTLCRLRARRQLERIAYYEARLDALQRILADGDPGAAARARACAAALAAYYGSREWRLDLAADAAGRLPATLRRGVLSEDGIFNALEAARDWLAEQT